MDDALRDSLEGAIVAAPADVHLKLHLARLLLDDGAAHDAVRLAADALALEPTNAAARTLMSEALAPPSTTPPAPHRAPGFDWAAAEGEVRDVATPMFTTSGPSEAPAFRLERSGIRLDDVGGMTAVKERINAAFLAPLRNAELRSLYGKSLKGGLLMYGPPGCGKTFIARAVAGELEATFLSVSVADILDPYLGRSEQNVHELFQLARREAPCVIFLDEIDAIGHRRSSLNNEAMRGTVNQLLTELDGIDGGNEGVFVLGATNQPWDVDPALRRPGRLDRTVLVLPPDPAAREAIFHSNLRHRPVEGIDLARLAALTEGFSGADIAYACETAAERALLDSVATGVNRYIGMGDLTGAITEVPRSTAPWFASARSVVLYGEDDGTFAELKAYLKKAKRL